MVIPINDIFTIQDGKKSTNAKNKNKKIRKWLASILSHWIIFNALLNFQLISVFEQHSVYTMEKTKTKLPSPNNQPLVLEDPIQQD